MDDDFSYDTDKLGVSNIKERLAEFPHALDQLQYVKFVVINWFMDQKLEVQIHNVPLPLFGNMNAAPWRESNRFTVFLTGPDPNVQWRTMELEFDENKATKVIKSTLKIPQSDVSFHTIANAAVVPTYDPNEEPRVSELDEDCISAIVSDCRVFLENVIEPYKAGKDVVG